MYDAAINKNDEAAKKELICGIRDYIERHGDNENLCFLYISDIGLIMTDRENKIKEPLVLEKDLPKD